MARGSKDKKGKKPLRIEISRLALCGWSLVFVLSLFWMFVLGLLVGKGLTPANINLKEIKNKMIAEGIWPGSKQPAPQERQRPAEVTKKIPIKDLEFYEALTRKKEATLRSRQQATAPPTTPALPTAAPAAHGRPRYSVQLASFKDRQSAEEFVRSLVGIQPPPAIKAVDLGARGRWYRVQVNNLPGRAEAEALAKKLAAQHRLQVLVIRSQ